MLRDLHFMVGDISDVVEELEKVESKELPNVPDEDEQDFERWRDYAEDLLEALLDRDAAINSAISKLRS